MPAEISRLSRRLGARDRRFVAAFACAAVAAVPVGIVLTHGSGSSTPGHCVTEQSVGFMGAQWLHLCGKDADAKCRSLSTDDSLAAQCRRIGD